VTGSGIGTGYTLSANPGTATPSTGTYNTPQLITMQSGSVGAGDVVLTIIDDVTQTCKFNLLINDPKTCDTGNLCLLEGSGIANIVCNDAATTETSIDDYVSFSLNPTGLGLTSSYLVTIISGGGTVSPSNGIYGQLTQFQFNVGSASQKYKVIRITDSQKTDCYFDLRIDSPGTCSGCKNPPCVPIKVLKN
jgi:hypothetical protein